MHPFTRFIPFHKYFAYWRIHYQFATSFILKMNVTFIKIHFDRYILVHFSGFGDHFAFYLDLVKKGVSALYIIQ